MSFHAAESLFHHLLLKLLKIANFFPKEKILLTGVSQLISASQCWRPLRFLYQLNKLQFITQGKLDFRKLHKIIAAEYLSRGEDCKLNCLRCTHRIHFSPAQVLASCKHINSLMFAPNALNYAPRVNSNMPTSLQISEAPSFFTDNVLMGTSTTCFTDGNTFTGDAASDSEFAKGIYNLRPRGALTHVPPPPRFEPEETPAPVKPKRQRSSLKKRLLVNARERDRMRVLNNGFQALRDALPCYIADGHMAKITTLRLAINYIKALNEVLNEEPPNGLPGPRCTTHHQPCTSSAPCNTTMIGIVTEAEHFKPHLPIDVSTIFPPYPPRLLCRILQPIPL